MKHSIAIVLASANGNLFQANTASNRDERDWLPITENPVMTINKPHENNTCSLCKFFHAHDQNGHGDCHRHPPVFAGDASPNERHRWRHPIVVSHDWCGEFLNRSQATTIHSARIKELTLDE
ncbi:hypothetical protein AB6Q56_17575 [Dechloromonas sp. ARDL1]|uniref:hypothetical protein n=1 Tax=Dechloromonas sp. ARDL1 TaxID=3322121 RepID=UPI003DA70A03